MSEVNPSEVLENEVKRLLHDSAVLDFYAESLGNIGMGKLEDILSQISTNIIQSASHIREANRDVISDRLHDAQQSSANMVKAALAMGKTVVRNKDGEVIDIRDETLEEFYLGTEEEFNG